jgi:hypothetical protein
MRSVEFETGQGLPDVAQPIVGESGYLIALQLKAIPFIDLRNETNDQISFFNVRSVER